MPAGRRCILFDLDGTLHDRATSVRALLAAQYRAFATELAVVSSERYLARALELDDHGYGDKPTMFARIVEELGLRAELAAVLTEHFFATYAEHTQAFPEVTGVLSALKARGVRLGLVTNGRVSMQESKVERLGLAPFLDVTVISEREGLKKPQVEIFQRAVQRLGATVETTWYVGDHPTIDVKGAVDAGLGAVWRRTTAWAPPLVPHHAIDDLSELLALVSREPDGVSAAR